MISRSKSRRSRDDDKQEQEQEVQSRGMKERKESLINKSSNKGFLINIRGVGAPIRGVGAPIGGVTLLSCHREDCSCALFKSQLLYIIIP